jgi:succinylglutamate desuccinylase
MPASMPTSALVAAVPQVTTAPGRQRLLGRRVDRPAGPWLIAVAGIHGNEPAGVAALGRVFAALEVSGEQLAGGFVAFAGNLGALAAERRFLERDLNRLWTEPELARARSGAAPETADERELAELDTAISAALAEAGGRVHLLDLHSTSGAGPAFAVLDDELANRRFALALPVPLVLGLEAELVGTMAFHWTARGLVCVAFEGGQHADPASVDRSEAAVWIALDAAGLLPPALAARAAAGRRLLRADRGGAPRLVEVRHRHRRTAGDGFEMIPGFASFARVGRGQPLARDHRGPVRAPFGGRLLMPLYQPQGDDGYFLAVGVARFWFELSAWVRRLGIGRLLPALPGVRRHPRVADAFVVNRLVARWAVREVFRMLGYKRLEQGRWRVVYARRAETR